MVRLLVYVEGTKPTIKFYQVSELEVEQVALVECQGRAVIVLVTSSAIHCPFLTPPVRLRSGFQFVNAPPISSSTTVCKKPPISDSSWG